jgi:hypothetical protein
MADGQSSIPNRNATAFKPNATGTASSSGSSNSNSSSGYIENPLNKVAQPAYHWTFGIAKAIGENNDIQVVIAETGKTGVFNITDIEMETVAGANFQTQNTQYSDFTITIVEPLGMSLPDKIIAANSYLGNDNLLKCPYLLKLKFQGYDPDSGSPLEPTDKTWTWKIHILDFQCTLDKTGAKYVIQAVNSNNLAHNNDVELIRSPMSIDVSKKEGKVGDVMKGLVKEINESIKKSYNVANGGIVPFTVKIEEVPYSDGIETGGAASPFEHKIIRDQKHLDGQSNQAIMQISKGTDVSKIIDYLMSASETATKMINPASSATSKDGEAKEYTTSHRIETRITNDSYNLKTQDYSRTITYYIMAHNSVRPIISPKGQDDALKQGAAKLAFLKSKGLIKKEYQYLFTGQNTEVLDFNVNLNFQFVTVQNAMDGQIFTENARNGRQYDPPNFNRQTMNEKWDKISPGVSPLTYCVAPLGSTTNTGDSVLDQLNTGTQQAEDLPNYPIFWPTTIIQSGEGTIYNVNQQIEATNNASRSIYAQVINQLYGADTANLSNIQLEIRGDPYWLGVTNVEDFKTTPSDTAASYAMGEHAFFVRFVIPQGIDENGAPILVPSNAFSGYYTALTVRHKFSSGQFTQTLEGVRIHTINSLNT